MSFLDEMWGAYEDWDDRPIDWYSNHWGWPTIFGIGAAKHPIDPEYDMIYMLPEGCTDSFWDERLQLEYAV